MSWILVSLTSSIGPTFSALALFSGSLHCGGKGKAAEVSTLLSSSFRSLEAKEFKDLELSLSTSEWPDLCQVTILELITVVREMMHRLEWARVLELG